MLASLSVITPFEVERIAMPKPLITLGNVLASAYFLKPGLLILVIFLIAGNLVCALYFNATLILP